MKTPRNPAGLATNPACSQDMVVRQPQRTVYAGGQDAPSVDGVVVVAGPANPRFLFEIAAMAVL